MCFLFIPPIGLSMCKFFWRPSIKGPGYLEVGPGGYFIPAAQDVSPRTPENASHDLETGTDFHHGDSETQARQSSGKCTLMSSSFKARDQASARDHPEAEFLNEISTNGGFGITLDQLVQVVGGGSLEADGVQGLSTRLKTDLKKGIDLRDDDILQRRQLFGANTYPSKQGKSFRRLLWKASQFPPSLVVMLAVVINSLLRIKQKAIHDGWYVEASAILVTVLDIIVRAIIEYKQSQQFEKFSEEKRIVNLEVIRGGRRFSVSTTDIVVGDLVPLKNGGQVPADGVLFVANSLKIDEQKITSSHELVQKDLQRDPFLLSGSKVIEGIGTMLVTSVGTNTVWWSKMEIPDETDEEEPFQVYLKRIAVCASGLVVFFASIACIVQLCQYYYGRTRKSDSTRMFILGITTVDEAADFVIKSLSFGIATIVVAVPSGLSIAVLMNLADTTRKMMSNNALVQTFSACERMGYVTTIVCHKTGVLTSNKMSVVDAWTGGIRKQDMACVSEWPTYLKELIIEGIAQNTNGSVVLETGVTEPEVYGSPTEQAILSWGDKLGMIFDDVRSASSVHYVIPFSPNKKYGGVALQVGTEHHVHWKGSAKIILNSCKWYMDRANNCRAIDERKKEIEGIIEEMCMGGKRCAALAYQSYEHGSLPPSNEERSRLPQDLVLLAIIGIEDPCQLGTKAAIKLCKYGGVKVRMVTEDDFLTAQAIAKECGILKHSSGPSDSIMTGAQFRAFPDLERVQIAGSILVLAEASPSDILLFVKALKANGHVVAATGMGIHDTMTLLEADVSLAMGIGGTASAKENSDIIILDDNFVTILKVIQWCRSLYTNIQRYVVFRLTVTVSAVAICLVEVVFYDAFPLNAVQLLLLNLIVDIFGALALAYRPTARRVMEKPPVGIRDPFITKRMWLKLVFQVSYLVGFLALIHSDGIMNMIHGQTGDAEKVKNTFIFSSLVFCLVFGEFEIRSGDQTWKEILKDNLFVVTVASTIIVQILAIEFLGIFISALRLDFTKWLLSILAGVLNQFATRLPFEAYQYYYSN